MGLPQALDGRVVWPSV